MVEGIVPSAKELVPTEDVVAGGAETFVFGLEKVELFCEMLMKR